MIIKDISSLSKKFHFTIIGSGPASLSLALKLEKKGFDVIIFEAGDISPTEVVGTIKSLAKDLNEIKKNYLKSINLTAYKLLHPTDWKVIKAQELSTTVDSKLTTYRSAIRTKCNELEKAMNDASTIAEITVIIDSPGVDENEDMILAPINDWPVLEE